MNEQRRGGSHKALLLLIPAAVLIAKGASRHIDTLSRREHGLWRRCQDRAPRPKHPGRSDPAEVGIQQLIERRLVGLVERRHQTAVQLGDRLCVRIPRDRRLLRIGELPAAVPKCPHANAVIGLAAAKRGVLGGHDGRVAEVCDPH